MSSDETRGIIVVGEEGHGTSFIANRLLSNEDPWSVGASPHRHVAYRSELNNVILIETHIDMLKCSIEFLDDERCPLNHVVFVFKDKMVEQVCSLILRIAATCPRPCEQLVVVHNQSLGINGEDVELVANKVSGLLLDTKWHGIDIQVHDVPLEEDEGFAAAVKRLRNLVQCSSVVDESQRITPSETVTQQSNNKMTERTEMPQVDTTETSEMLQANTTKMMIEMQAADVASQKWFTEMRTDLIASPQGMTQLETKVTEMWTDHIESRQRITQLQTEMQTFSYQVKELEQFQKLVETEMQTLNRKVEELQKIVFPWYRRNIDKE